jgi:hypothetical protein
VFLIGGIGETLKMVYSHFWHGSAASGNLWFFAINTTGYPVEKRDPHEWHDAHNRMGVYMDGLGCVPRGRVVRRPQWRTFVCYRTGGGSAPIAGVMALVMAFFFYRSIIAANPGNARMQEIAGYVREGAYAYLRRQYKVVGVVFLVLVALLSYMAFVLGRAASPGAVCLS